MTPNAYLCWPDFLALPLSEVPRTISEAEHVLSQRNMYGVVCNCHSEEETNWVSFERFPVIFSVRLRRQRFFSLSIKLI